jgi:uncharacterized membrane protein
MNLMHYIIGGKITPKKSAQQIETDKVLARYAELVKAAEARKKTWPEIAEQLKSMKPIALDVSSAELIRSIRDEL